jgi:predicted phosphoribosyltransferase
MASRFRDRRDAGVRLAARLGTYAGRRDVVVLALPRGGVPVASEVARALRAPLDVFLVRKLGVPFHRELAMGAIASGGVRVLNTAILEAFGIPTEAVDAVAREEEAELARRECLYRGDRAAPDVRGKVIVLVDDGLATGATMRAAVTALRRLGPARIVVAVPTASAEACTEMAAAADEVVCAETPEPFLAVGASYEDFSETTDADVRRLLAQAA